MIGSDDQKSSSIYNRSYTINSISTDFSIKPYLNSSFQRSESVKKVPDLSFGSIKGKVRNICNLFESRRASKLSSNVSKLNTGKSNSIEESICSKSNSKDSDSPKSIRLPGTEDRVVVYFTSLRGIRRTYEDCYSVRMILKFFRVVIDERDISMDSNYKNELLNVLCGNGNTKISLPQVFIKGKYVGDADVIKQLHETGQLGKMLKELPVRSTNAWQVCDACGDVRFIPCANCNGSKKVYDEDEELLKRCPDCNENGLIRCPTCCS